HLFHHRKARRLVSGDFAKLGSLFQNFLRNRTFLRIRTEVSAGFSQRETRQLCALPIDFEIHLFISGGVRIIKVCSYSIESSSCIA
ncbi:hypothetical protein, partial [Pseudomonas amygdali]|uniref:hypothetical protein n=1 Tax=Pseudomonas amygdali TaxID=47877 RepID=UPI001F468AB6